MKVGINESVMSLAVSKSNSLRTTVPMHIVQQLGLKVGDRIVWNLDKVDDTWIVNVVKK